MSFPAYGTALDCPTVTQNPQTFYGNQGPAKWELSKHKGGLHGVTIVGNDTKDAARGGTILALTAQQAGIKTDQGDPVVSVSGRDPQSVFTPIVQKMKHRRLELLAERRLGQPGAVAPQRSRRSRASTRRRSSGSARRATATSSSRTTREAFEGEVQFLGFLPFEEASVNKTVANFVKYMKQVGGTPDQFSAYSYAAMLAFADAVNAVVKSNGVNGAHPRQPDHRDQGPHRLRRRRHDRQALVQGRQDHVVLHDGPVQERQVGAPVPDEEGHVRLQGVERDHHQGEPDRLSRSGARSRPHGRRPVA